MKKNKKEITLQDLENEIILHEAIFQKKNNKIKLDEYFNIKIMKKNDMIY